MKHRYNTSRSIILFAFVLSFSGFCSVKKALGCFAIVAGRETTVDGSVLVGHSEMNDPPPQYLNFKVIPRMQNPEGSVIHLRNGGVLDDVGESYAFLWSEIVGSTGSDGMINEWGVVCVSDATRTRPVDWDSMVASGQIKDGGISWRIRTEIARRARTAREGIRITGDLMEKYGYARGGVTLIIADPVEAWIVSLCRGPRWVAQRVPDDRVVVLANVNIIGEIDLADTNNFKASKGLESFAASQGWYDPAAGLPFHFSRAYDDPHYHDPWFSEKYGCDPRQWRGQCLVTGQSIPLPVHDELPFSVKPYKKLSVQDLRTFLSDHLEGTPMDRSEGYTVGSPHDVMSTDDGLICNQANQEVAVFQLRDWMPAEVGCVYWRITAASCTGVMTPWYLGLNNTPAPFDRFIDTPGLSTARHFDLPPGIFDHDPDLAFWIFNEMENIADINYADNAGKIKKAWHEMEGSIFLAQDAFEQEALVKLRDDYVEGRAFITTYCHELALQALNLAKALNHELKSGLYGY